MKTVLLVDENHLILDLLENKIKKVLDVRVLKARTYKEAANYISEEEIIHIAILDLNLQDAKDGQIVDYAISEEIPSVILTDVMDDKLQKIILNKDIIDYVFKTDLNSMEYTVNIVNRTLNNYDLNILVVDDSKFQLSVIKKILTKMKINVTTANNGKEALQLIKNQADDHKFSLILTDYEMPEMDGLELTVNIRGMYKKDHVSIIVMSTNDNLDTATKFIKIGANDFIAKPFTQTEFITRVNSNLDLLDLFEKTKELATRDYLTCSYNRRFFFDSGESITNKVKRKKGHMAVAIVDIDDFQEINDAHGYDIGDCVIQDVSRIINSKLRSSDLVSRFKDDEFAILLEDISLENTRILFNKIQESLVGYSLQVGEVAVSFHISIGVFYGQDENLDVMIKKAKLSLENAKLNGKKQIFINEH
ncbi:MAG: response regulator [Campylobacteraceae bacterium]|nr:response regulator [Campylobacteraceae bacterium]